MVREVQQCAYLGLAAVQLVERGSQLCRHVADEFGLQRVAVVGQVYLLLLLTGQQDVAHQHDGPHDECGGQCSGQYQ